MRARRGLGLEARAYGAIARVVARRFGCLHRVDEIHAAALRGAEFARLSYRDDTGASLSSWMYTKAKWAAVDEARGSNRKGRARGPEVVSLDEEVGEGGWTAMDVIGTPSHESRVLQRMYCEHLLSAVSAREGWLCRSYFLEGWSESYLARSIGISESRVSQAIGAALKKMRAFAEEWERDEVSFTVRKCSICHKPGHKSTTCPERRVASPGDFQKQALSGDPIKAAMYALEDELAAIDKKRASVREALDAIRKLVDSRTPVRAVSPPPQPVAPIGNLGSYERPPGEEGLQ